MEKYDVIVVGAGLSGLSAAFELVEKEKKVLLLEARDFVGGRCSSWEENGMKVESGLHRFLGFYEELPFLCKRAGIDLNDMLIWENEIEIRLPDNGPMATFGASGIGKPIKTVTSMIGNNDMFSLKEKAEIVKLFSAATLDFAKDKESLDKVTVLEYAKKYKISQNVIERLLIPVTAGIFFLPPEKYSMFVLASFLGVPKWDLLKMSIGAFSGGMTEVMSGPIAHAVEKGGGEVRTGVIVESLLMYEKRVVGVKTPSGEIFSENVILATSLGPAQKLLNNFAHHDFFKPMLSLPTMPAVTIQFELHEPAMDLDHTTFGPLTCFASFSEQSRTTFRHAKGRLSVILTPPERYLTLSKDDVLHDVLKDAKRLDINLTKKNIIDYRIITEHMDFYELSPRKESLKPTQQTPIVGLTLAGDYTKQPYLSTMEGAVISGRLAAESIVA